MINLRLESALLASLSHASGRRCKNTSPSNPPTAKLKSTLRVLELAAVYKKISKKKSFTFFCKNKTKINET